MSHPVALYYSSLKLNWYWLPTALLIKLLLNISFLGMRVQLVQGVRNDMVINDGSVCFMMGQCNAMMVLPIEMFFFYKRGSKGQIKLGDI